MEEGSTLGATLLSDNTPCWSQALAVAQDTTPASTALSPVSPPCHLPSADLVAALAVEEAHHQADLAAVAVGDVEGVAAPQGDHVVAQDPDVVAAVEGLSADLSVDLLVDPSVPVDSHL